MASLVRLEAIRPEALAAILEHPTWLAWSLLPCLLAALVELRPLRLLPLLRPPLIIRALLLAVALVRPLL